MKTKFFMAVASAAVLMASPAPAQQTEINQCADLADQACRNGQQVFYGNDYTTCYQAEYDICNTESAGGSWGPGGFGTGGCAGSRINC